MTVICQRNKTDMSQTSRILHVTAISSAQAKDGSASEPLRPSRSGRIIAGRIMRSRICRLRSSLGHRKSSVRTTKELNYAVMGHIFEIHDEFGRFLTDFLFKRKNSLGLYIGSLIRARIILPFIILPSEVAMSSGKLRTQIGILSTSTSPRLLLGSIPVAALMLQRFEFRPRAFVTLRLHPTIKLVAQIGFHVSVLRIRCQISQLVPIVPDLV